MSEPALVTGGCGFVGRHLTERLLAEEREVHIVDNCINGDEPSQWLPRDYDETSRKNPMVYDGNGRLEFYNEDLRNWIHRHPDGEYDEIYHLAAIIGGRESIEAEPIRVGSDLAIDAEFLNWVVSAQPDRILYASSSAAYPIRLQTENERRKLAERDISFEETIGVPDMTYGWAKLTGEYLSRLMANNHDISVAVVRPFSGYGSEQSFDYPIPTIARRVIRKEDPLTIWGSGNQVRDFVHIEDCIEGMIRAIDRIDDGSAVNIGTGIPTNFKEVASIFAELAGYDPDIKPLPNKPEGPSYRCADTTRMEDILDWSPSISVEEGFARVHDNLKSRLR